MKLNLVKFAPVVRENEHCILLDQVHHLFVRRIRKFGYKVFQCRIFIISKCDMTNPFLCCRYQNISEWTLGKTVIDRKIFASILVLARCHALYINEKVVQSTGS